MSGRVVAMFCGSSPKNLQVCNRAEHGAAEKEQQNLFELVKRPMHSHHRGPPVLRGKRFQAANVVQGTDPSPN
jgi:hypothetical protein